MLQSSIRKGVSIVLVLLGSVCATLFAQSDLSSVSGFVRDASNAMVPGAQVTLTNEATGGERSTKTNESGYYVFTPVPAGNYTVTVELAGFKKLTRTNNKV